MLNYNDTLNKKIAGRISISIIAILLFFLGYSWISSTHTQGLLKTVAVRYTNPNSTCTDNQHINKNRVSKQNPNINLFVGCGGFLE